MIHSLSKNITAFFMLRDLIENDEKEVVQYGAEIIISTLIGFGIILGVGGCFRDIKFAVAYLFFIVPIRMCVGGFHAKTYFSCNVIFLLVFLVGFSLNIKLGSTGYKIISAINLCSSILIFYTAPFENRHKRISEKKKKVFKIVDLAIYVFSGISGVITTNIYLIYVLNIVLLNVTILLIMGKGVNYNEKENQSANEKSC